MVFHGSFELSAAWLVICAQCLVTDSFVLALLIIFGIVNILVCIMTITESQRTYQESMSPTGLVLSSS